MAGWFFCSMDILLVPRSSSGPPRLARARWLIHMASALVEMAGLKWDVDSVASISVELSIYLSCCLLSNLSRLPRQVASSHDLFMWSLQQGDHTSYMAD